MIRNICMLKFQQARDFMEKYYPILEKCAMFKNISKEDLQGILCCMDARIMTYREGETIFSEGDKPSNIGIVLTGVGQIVKIDYLGYRTIMANVEPGELFGESFVYAGIKALPVSVIAAKNSEVMVMNATRIINICSNSCEFHRQIIFNLLKVVANKNLIFSQKLEVTSKRSTREKLMAYLLIQAKSKNSNKFTIPFDRQELADYLGVDRSGLSAEIGKLRKEGVLDCEKDSFTIKNANVL